MKPVHWISRPDVVSALTKADAHCRLMVGLDGPFQVWSTSWGAYFIVPTIGKDKMCPEDDLTRILQDIERRRP